ncbi:hypothetical protein TREVI0001_0215 [Treponema vincentii ATCC 35580]|uniref:Uncharacterized protein n=1 Tax=Treponema vincentii ATCC 35580 TaxID=596324 RepID=C8PTX2_9SPIR|nr:hypothetical protein TREVI0001_0215 [Treponema vincentii ATCC 35580]
MKKSRIRIASRYEIYAINNFQAAIIEDDKRNICQLSIILNCKQV